MMKSPFKNSMLMRVMAIAIALLQAWPELAQANEWNLDSYHLTLYPTETTPIRLYDMNSQYLGALARESKITIVVSGAMVRASLVNGQPDIRRVLQASSYRDVNGNYALQLASNGDLRTQEGRQLAAGTRFIVAMNDFLALAPGSTAAEQESFDVSTGTSEDATAFEEVEEDDEAEGVVETRVEQFDIEMTRLRGRPFPTEILSSPVCDCGPSCRFTSPYGPRRSRRTTNGRRMSSNHKGLDIGAPNGTPIIAAAPGCVSRIDRQRTGYGNTIYLAHGNGYETQYSHLTSFAPGIAAGKCFERGEKIGVSGSTGNVTGPHLHFGLLKDGVRIDPRSRFAASARTDRATRVRCSALLSYPNIDDAMRTALGIGGQGSFSSARRSSSSN